MTTTRKKIVGGGELGDMATPFIKCVEQYGVISVLFLVIAVAFFFIVRSPGYIQQNLEKYFFILCVPLLLLFFMILQIENSAGLAAKVAGILLIGGIVAWVYTQTNMSYIFSIALSWISILLIVIVALTFLYGYIVSEMRRWRGWPGFIAQVIFFLPCLAHEAWTAFMAELKLTSVSIYFALVLEAALVVLYVTLPRISKSVMGTDDTSAKVLLNNPMRLSVMKQVAGSDDLFNHVNGSYRQNYAIGMWVYITAHGQSVPGYHDETQIFSYGYKGDNGTQHVKPMIRYYGGGVETESTEDRNKFVVYVSQFPPPPSDDTEQDSLYYDATLPLQRWNYIVLNYSHNEVDLFLNAELKRTFSLRNAMPLYGPLDTITVGEPTPEKTGVRGGICNVVYYKHTLTPEQIAFSYNLLKDRDPPIMTVGPATSSPASSPAS